MKNKVVFIILGIMAAAFVYLKIKQAVGVDGGPPLNLPLEKGEKKSAEILVGNVVVNVEIANTPEARAQGLSGREPLAELQGMLFKMDEPLRHTFWMKDMKFALDIIWIRDGIIVDISENVSPPTGDQAPAIVQPIEPADTVLEVNADFTEKYGVKIGDKAELLTM